MINFDEYTNENKIEHNLKWPYIPDDLYRILIVGGYGSGKTNALLNLINNQPNIDKIYLYLSFTYYPLGRAFEKQTKTIENQGKKQVDVLADLKPKETKSIKTEPNKYGDYFLNRSAKIRESSEPIDFNNLIYQY